MAGVLAGGAGAALSNSSAADHWDLTGLARPMAHVTVVTHRRPRPGVVFHTRRLPDDELTEHEGIPITTVARTLFDLATESPARLRQAIAIAEARAMGDRTSVVDLVARYPGRRGVASLRRELEVAQLERGIASHELELRFSEFIDRCGLPRPERNARVQVAGRTLVVDCLWREPGLVVELDSRLHHGDWEAAENDRARDAALLAVGLSTVRITWRRLHDEPHRLEAELRAGLEIHVRRAWRG
jgi:hypothetical protein